MKLITRDTDYAIRALCAIIRKKGELVSASELTAELKIPRPFLRKILQMLNKHKILHSIKGKGGGFCLAKRPDAIRLTELMRIFQGDLKLNECLFRKRVCPNVRACPLRKSICRIEKYVLGELGAITIGSLLK